MFSKQNGKSKAEMDNMIILSLYTDGQGQRRDEFGNLRDKLTGSSTIPGYVVVDPWAPEKVLYKTDYNTAIDDDAFGPKLGKAARRVQRAMKRRRPVAVEEK